MPRGLIALLVGVVAAIVGPLAAPAEEVTPGGADETFFETRIRPVLSGTCVECHGPDVASGGLRLDTRDGLLKGGDRGPAVVPGDACCKLVGVP